MVGTETALANYTEWPRDVSSKRYIEDFLKMLTLRGLSVAIVTPFLCSSMIETVQSVIVVRDRPSFIDCLKDGFSRLLHLRSTPSIRMLPIWLLVVPTVFYQVTHLALWQISKKCIELFRSNMVSESSKKTASRQMQQNQRNTENSIMNSTWQPPDLTLNTDLTDPSTLGESIEKASDLISTSIMANLVADIALLPLETILNSLYIQGTRTIIDNCDETTVVLPVLTNYEGFADCFQSILRFEGNIGLYKGLGAIVLQYTVHFLLFRSVYYLLSEFQSSYINDIAKPSTSTKRKRKLVDPHNEFTGFIEGNRHSTPINPTDHYRFDDDNRLGDLGTPRRLLSLEKFLANN